MNIDYEMIRVQRLARGIIRQKLPLANADRAASTEPSGTKRNVIVRASNRPNALTIQEGLRLHGYETRIVDEPQPGLECRIVAAREWNGSPASLDLPQPEMPQASERETGDGGQLLLEDA